VQQVSACGLARDGNAVLLVQIGHSAKGVGISGSMDMHANVGGQCAVRAANHPLYCLSGQSISSRKPPDRPGHLIYHLFVTYFIV
jgi:hypothetical protein